MRIEELGEFGLIDRIRGILPEPGKDVIVGIGDDVAVLRGNSERVWLATCDVQMEGAHFLLSAVRPRDLGRKALAINQSDIAATGGEPRFALVSLGLPGDLAVDFIDELYTGLRMQALDLSMEIVGGNISRSRLGLFIDIFLLGEAPRQDILLRSGAHPGDKILVTGTLGDAGAAVALLLNPNLTATEPYAEIASTRFSLPTPRVREGRVIAGSHMASAMLDISDGLASDLGHICEKSNVGARVVANRLPVSPENRCIAQAAHGDEWHFALYGGEDYELLFTAPAENADALMERITRECGTQVSIIGEILSPGDGRQLVLADGRRIPLIPQGWDHFRKQN